MTVVRIWKEHYIKHGQRSGVTEIREPYLYSNGKYKVGDPSLGKEHNLTDNAIECDSLDEVAEFIRKGFEVRMRSGTGKPSMNSHLGMNIEVI